MSEPAKDEAELMERVAEALYDNYDLDLPMSFTLAAIRAAGWAVVPAILTKNMDYDFLRAENARLREAVSYYRTLLVGKVKP
jgi:hypothetical protein